MFPNNEAKVVQLLADQMAGAQTIADFQIPKDRPVKLGELNNLLKIRKVGVKLTTLVRRKLVYVWCHNLSHNKIKVPSMAQNPC